MGGLGVLGGQKLHELLGPQSRPLVKYAHRHDFLERWQKISLRRFYGVVLMWLCSITFKYLDWTSGECVCAQELPEQIGISIVLDGVLAMLVMCQLHVCTALEL